MAKPELRKLLKAADPDDIADLLVELDAKKAAQVAAALGRRLAAVAGERLRAADADPVGTVADIFLRGLSR